jgi:hypothetical protein
VLRRGGTVVRPPGSWTPAVHALLRHLEQAGFTGAPRVVGDGYDGQGREVLTFIEGTFVHPGVWSDDGIWQAGQLLRALHDATAGFKPPPDAAWHPWPFRAEAVQAQVTPDSADAAPLWALAWRARSAAWMIRHRALLEKAITT